MAFKIWSFRLLQFLFHMRAALVWSTLAHCVALANLVYLKNFNPVPDSVYSIIHAIGVALGALNWITAFYRGYLRMAEAEALAAEPCEALPEEQAVIHVAAQNHRAAAERAYKLNMLRRGNILSVITDASLLGSAMFCVNLVMLTLVTQGILGIYLLEAEIYVLVFHVPVFLYCGYIQGVYTDFGTLELKFKSWFNIGCAGNVWVSLMQLTSRARTATIPFLFDMLMNVAFLGVYVKMSREGGIEEPRRWLYSLENIPMFVMYWVSIAMTIIMLLVGADQKLSAIRKTDGYTVIKVLPTLHLLTDIVLITTSPLYFFYGRCLGEGVLFVCALGSWRMFFTIFRYSLIVVQILGGKARFHFERNICDKNADAVSAHHLVPSYDIGHIASLDSSDAFSTPEMDKMASARACLSIKPACSIGSDSSKAPVRILCLDGGGMKGLCLIEMLRSIEIRCGLPISDLFDLVVGTSAGGAISLCITSQLSDGLRNAEEIMYTIGDKLFREGSTMQMIRHGQRVKRELVIQVVDQAGGLPDAMKDIWEQQVRRPFAEGNVKEGVRVPHCCAVAARANSRGEWNSYHLRNYDCGQDSSGNLVSAGAVQAGCSDAPMRVCCRATTAAPTYFQPVEFKDTDLVDGGVAANNPTLNAIIEAGSVFPDRKIGCIVSLGCGKVMQSKSMSNSAFYWLGAMLDLATNSYKTHNFVKQLISSVPDLTASCTYFRLDPPTGDVPLDEWRHKTLSNMRDKAQAYVARKRAKIDRLCLRLLQLTLEPEEEPNPLLFSKRADPMMVSAELERLKETLDPSVNQRAASKTVRRGPRIPTWASVDSELGG